MSIQFVLETMKRCGDNKHSLESITPGERLWFNSADTDTKLWAEIQWLNDQQQASVNNVVTQPSPKLTTRLQKQKPGPIKIENTFPQINDISRTSKPAAWRQCSS